jgi:hypothetical protein
LERAGLSFSGYPRAIGGKPESDVVFVYEETSPTGPYARHAGSYTKYGDVRPLLAKAEDQFVIFGSGEQVAVEFDASKLPRLPRGWKRDYLLYVDGFNKDMDFYGAYSGGVEPLPFHGMGQYPYPDSTRYPDSASYLDYRLNWNTRNLSGRAVESFRFQYSLRRR